MPTHVTENYATVQSRIPTDLLEAVKRYASLHRCSVSELIRDGLEWRIEQDAPGRFWHQQEGSTRAPEEGQAILKVQQALDALQERLTSMQSTMHDTLRDAFHSVLQTQDKSQSTTGEVAGSVLQTQDNREEQTPETLRDVLQTQDITGEQATPPESFDPYTHWFGPLCANGHDWRGLGGSLRSLKGKKECVECKRLRDAAYKARKRVAA